ncbi:MAG: Transcriptional regulatory protein dltR [Parcubacteria group bacterium GW2011_GWF2_44_8]|nr:MAG: Transcriptional regulatory protein dltR [Parcubacteria group bacterium GW2011_GWF2_44_8]
MAYNILLCEDEEFVARSYKRKLELEGFVVHQARNGQEAIDMIFGPQKFDLILMDLMMPLKTGFEVLTEVIDSSNEEVKKVPIIVASNLGQIADIEEAKKLGAVDFVVKSNISLKELILKIRQYLPQ